MNAYAALLRGVNVGGHNIIKMAALRDLCGEIGLEQPRTLLQSGNVVFRATENDPADVEAMLAAAIAERFGFQVDVMVRTEDDLSAVIDGCPLRAAATADPRRVVAMFLADAPESRSVADLQSQNQGPEVIAPGEGVIYIHYPDGMGRSKLTNTVVEKRLGVRGTARNWNTVTGLQELAKAAAGA